MWAENKKEVILQGYFFYDGRKYETQRATYGWGSNGRSSEFETLVELS